MARSRRRRCETRMGEEPGSHTAPPEFGHPGRGRRRRPDRRRTAGESPRASMASTRRVELGARERAARRRRRRPGTPANTSTPSTHRLPGRPLDRRGVGRQLQRVLVGPGVDRGGAVDVIGLVVDDHQAVGGANRGGRRSPRRRDRPRAPRRTSPGTTGAAAACRITGAARIARAAAAISSTARARPRPTGRGRRAPARRRRRRSPRSTSWSTACTARPNAVAPRPSPPVGHGDPRRIGARRAVVGRVAVVGGRSPVRGHAPVGARRRSPRSRRPCATRRHAAAPPPGPPRRLGGPAPAAGAGAGAGRRRPGRRSVHRRVDTCPRRRRLGARGPQQSGRTTRPCSDVVVRRDEQVVTRPGAGDVQQPELLVASISSSRSARRSKPSEASPCASTRRRRRRPRSPGHPRDAPSICVVSPDSTVIGNSRPFAPCIVMMRTAWSSDSGSSGSWTRAMSERCSSDQATNSTRSADCDASNRRAWSTRNRTRRQTSRAAGRGERQRHDPALADDALDQRARRRPPARRPQLVEIFQRRASRDGAGRGRAAPHRDPTGPRRRRT